MPIVINNPINNHNNKFNVIVMSGIIIVIMIFPATIPNIRETFQKTFPYSASYHNYSLTSYYHNSLALH